MAWSTENWTRTARGTLVLAAVFCALTGCSLAIATSGFEESLIPGAVDGLTKAQVHERYGGPSRTGSCPDARRFERYRIRVKLISGTFDQNANGIARDPQAAEILLMLEPILLPVAAIASEAKKVPVTVVYGDDGRVLYSFSGSDRDQLFRATTPLRMSLEADLTEASAPSEWVARLIAYVDEVRHRAACMKHVLSPAGEAALDEVVALAPEAAWGIATKGDALAKIWILAQQFR